MTYQEKMMLPVLQQFADLVPEVWEILDKTFVVYEGEPEKQLVLNYRRVEGERAEAQYHEMELPCVCDGIYAAGFILFPGERLQYYVLGQGANISVGAQGRYFTPFIILLLPLIANTAKVDLARQKRLKIVAITLIANFLVAMYLILFHYWGVFA